MRKIGLRRPPRRADDAAVGRDAEGQDRAVARRWLALVKKKGGKDELARREWLKKEHGLGTNSAWWIAERSVGKGEEAGDPELYLKEAERYVEAMFTGKRAALRPLYDALLKVVARRREGRQGVPVPDDRADLPEARHRPDQAGDQHAHRIRPGAGRYEKDAEAAGRYRRPCQEGPDHARASRSPLRPTSTTRSSGG